jgi:hypothetical protein
MPKHCYVYAIDVDGVRRYIGKGSNGRMYAHMKEVRQRLTRKFKLKNVSPVFQRKLTEAVMKGAVVEAIVLAENLTSKQAYQLEYRHLEKMVYVDECHAAQSVCVKRANANQCQKRMSELFCGSLWKRRRADHQNVWIARVIFAAATDFIGGTRIDATIAAHWRKASGGALRPWLGAWPWLMPRYGKVGWRQRAQRRAPRWGLIRALDGHRWCSLI